MSFRTLKIMFYLAIIMFHGYIVFYICQTIFRSIKMIRDNGNIIYLTKTWKVIFRHKSVCVYSVLFLFYVLVGIKIAKECALLHPSNKDSAFAMLPTIIHIFVLRYIFGMSIALNIKNIACGRKKSIGISMLTSLFYYYPAYLWKRFKAYDILRDDVMSFQIKAICYVLERGKYKAVSEKAEILKNRFYLYGVQQILEVPVLLYIFITLVFSIDLFEIWSWRSILAIIVKGSIAAVIAASMFIETLAIIYTCQLYLWNQKWEETYSGVLSQGNTAPYIETIEFPELT